MLERINLLDNLNLNIFNVLILLGVIHGLIFGAILLINKNLRSQANKYLALTIFSLSFSNLQYWLKDVELYPTQFNLPFIPFEFLMLPFFLFFVKSFINKKITTKEKVVFLSFFLFSLFTNIFLLNQISTKI